MKQRIIEISTSAPDLKALSSALIDYFTEMKSIDDRPITYVSGIITSEGPEKESANLQRLAGYTESIRIQKGDSVFSPTDIFNVSVFARFSKTGATNHDYEVFWQEVLGSGLVSEMVMTPRWEISGGCTMEHNIAKEMKMNIVYLTEELT